VSPSVVRRPPSRQALAAEWRPAAVAVVAGGAIGPLLLVAGLARTDAAGASILLNTELVATVVLAALFFGEHIGRRLLSSVVLITAAGVLLTWGPGAAVDVGAVLIIAACVAWGLDNCVTAHIEQLTPQQVVAMKGIAAGGVNLVIGLSISGWGPTTDAAQVMAALVIGAAGYGLSITLWVRGARQLGAARGQLIFATAPFIGAIMAWTVLDEPVGALQVVAVLLAAAGIAVAARPVHVHEHRHDLLVHSHPHVSGLHHGGAPR
jgi:drug/metabolite transporter (DMT)-like permease